MTGASGAAAFIALRRADADAPELWCKEATTIAKLQRHLIKGATATAKWKRLSWRAAAKTTRATKAVALEALEQEQRELHHWR